MTIPKFRAWSEEGKKNIDCNRLKSDYWYLDNLVEEYYETK